MKTLTWKPGTNPEMDSLFENLREQRFNDRSHRLWENYSKDGFKYAVALTICFDDFDIPELCSSISYRDCWPKNAYRISSRLWKHSNKIAYPKRMSASFGETAKSQIEWLSENTDWELCFISRQSGNWEQFAIENFQRLIQTEFKTDNYRYLTCPNECDDSCWQKIIYHGNEDILKLWNRRQ